MLEKRALQWKVHELKSAGMNAATWSLLSAAVSAAIWLVISLATGAGAAFAVGGGFLCGVVVFILGYGFRRLFMAQRRAP